MKSPRPTSVEFIDVEAHCPFCGDLVVHDWLAEIDGQLRSRMRYYEEAPHHVAYVDGLALMVAKDNAEKREPFYERQR